LARHAMCESAFTVTEDFTLCSVLLTSMLLNFVILFKIPNYSFFFSSKLLIPDSSD